MRVYIAIILLGCLPALHADPPRKDISIPARKSFVTDLTGTLTSGQIQKLNKELRTFKRDHGPEIAVLIIRTTGRETVENFSLRTARSWKPGDPSRGDGILVLVAKQDRKLRIEVGRGLQSRLSNEQAARIIRKEITPQFKQARYARGLEQGLRAVQKQLLRTHTKAGDSPPAAPHTNDEYNQYKFEIPQRSRSNDFRGPFFILIFIGFSIIIFLVMASSKRESNKGTASSDNSPSSINNVIIYGSQDSSSSSSYGGGSSSGFSSGGSIGGRFDGGGSSGDW